ncbi:hypothetical protein XavaCFBP5823_13620 [Xanthomonas axonopodis pv. vasculorum]|nr:hypothetical protein XavaCFBP5823_13620 [Xanthomonas axonopodis pv. vasculorum]
MPPAAPPRCETTPPFPCERRLCASTVPPRASAGLHVPAASGLWADREHPNAARLAPCHPLL